MAAHSDTRECLHPTTYTEVSVFALAQRRYHVRFMAPCLMLRVDKRMLELVRRFYQQNRLADPQAHLRRLRAKHDNGICTCFYEPDVRHVDAATRAFAA